MHSLAQIKDWIKHTIGLSDALIHVNVGLGLFLLIALLLRRHRQAALIAWLVVLVAQIGNEVFDSWIELHRRGRINVAEAIRDTIATVFWPTVLLVLWWVFRPAQPGAPSENS